MNSTVYLVVVRDPAHIRWERVVGVFMDPVEAETCRSGGAVGLREGQEAVTVPIEVTAPSETVYTVTIHNLQVDDWCKISLVTLDPVEAELVARSLRQDGHFADVRITPHSLTR